MVKKHESNKYVVIEDIRASYNAHDDTIHLTSGDPDLASGGFHLKLNQGTATEKQLRKILDEQGLLNAPHPAVTKNLFSITVPKSPQVISLVSPKGGSGKTVTTNLLATSLVAQGLKVAVIDMDVQDGQFAYFVRDKELTVVEAMAQPAIEVARYLTASSHGWSVLLPPCVPKKVDEKKLAEYYTDAIEVLREHYDVILLDTPTSLSNRFRREAAQASDFTLILTNPRTYALAGVQSLIQHHLDEYQQDLADGSAALLLTQTIRQSDETTELIEQVASQLAFVFSISFAQDLLSYNWNEKFGQLVSSRHVNSQYGRVNTPLSREFHKLSEFFAHKLREWN